MNVTFTQRLIAEMAGLFRAARRLTRSEADAQDLVQGTLVRAIEQRATLREAENMHGWLTRVQRTVLLNGRRGLSRRLEILEGGNAQVGEPAGNLEAEIIAQTLSDELQHALSCLSAELRDALLLRELDGLSYEEIAKAQGCPIGTVRSRLARARLSLIESLATNDRKSSWQVATKIGSRASRLGTTAR